MYVLLLINQTTLVIKLQMIFKKKNSLSFTVTEYNAHFLHFIEADARNFKGHQGNAGTYFHLHYQPSCDYTLGSNSHVNTT